MVFQVVVVNLWPQDGPHIPKPAGHMHHHNPLIAVTSILPLFLLTCRKATMALALEFDLGWGAGGGEGTGLGRVGMRGQDM